MGKNDGTSSIKRSRDEEPLTARQVERMRLIEAPLFSVERTIYTGKELSTTNHNPVERVTVGPQNETITKSIFQVRKPGILTIGCDVMAQVLAFLEPPEVLFVLTSPLSGQWQTTYCHQPEMWRTLCIAEPFKAQVQDSATQYKHFCYKAKGTGELWPCEKFRMLYTSFVRCVKYLQHLQLVAVNGDGTTQGRSQEGKRNGNETNEQVRIKQSETCSRAYGLASKRQKITRKTRVQGAVHYASSSITQRLLLPTSDGATSHTDLPWSCAIFSIINWMATFPNVEGIQIKCLNALQPILEHENQRRTAQRAGLVNNILRAMVNFPSSIHLNTSAFRAIVVLARPLGGREGMLFHDSMENAFGVLSSNAGGNIRLNLIEITLDAMKRFQSDEVLQATSCWALVNIALDPNRKNILIQSQGVQAIIRAMESHPENAEVQYRALFALINLVIPPKEDSLKQDNTITNMLDRIIRLVVCAMRKHFSRVDVLNRACLVLFNLSLSRDYHQELLLSPQCYDMLEWSMAKYQTDPVLQRAVTRTLHHLQRTLRHDKRIRARFTSIRLSRARGSAEREAIILRQLEASLVNHGAPDQTTA